MAKVKDYYETLGIGKDAGPDDMKKAYRRLARKHHPALNPGDKSAEERFKEINEAYGVLSDPKKKEQYDRFGSAGFEGMAGPWYEEMRGAPGGFEDIFGAGDIFSGLFGAGIRPEAGIRRRGEDLIMDMAVTLDEAFAGATKKVSITREIPCSVCGGGGAEEEKACDACKGKGSVQTSRGFFRMSQTCRQCGGTGKKVTKACRQCGGAGITPMSETLNVRIPAGVDDESLVKLRGMGNAGYGGGTNGDLHIRIHLRPHPLFERKGGDLYITVPVTFGEAALGAKIEVPTIDGSAVMTLPPGTQGGQRFKLRGKGFPEPRTGRRGDMFVSIQVAVPKDISAKTKEAIKNIEASYAESPRKGLSRT